MKKLSVGTGCNWVQSVFAFKCLPSSNNLLSVFYATRNFGKRYRNHDLPSNKNVVFVRDNCFPYLFFQKIYKNHDCASHNNCCAMRNHDLPSNKNVVFVRDNCFPKENHE